MSALEGAAAAKPKAEGGAVTCLGYTLPLGDISVLPIVVGFTISSSMLSVINKMSLVVFPFPALLTALQYATCVAVVLGLGALGVLEHDRLTLATMRRFSPAALVFYLSLFTNMHLLQASNVDTFIVFRSCSPILVALADYFFRAQPWPSAATFGSLFVITAGAVGYVAVEKGLTIKAYSWAVAYLCTITLDMVYIKHIVMEVKLNTWGLVLYNNLLALLLFPLFFYLTGEFVEASALLPGAEWRAAQALPVLLSCAFGLAISFFAMACRKAISATAFTVLGVTNKFLTVTVNVTVWDRHASPLGVLCLCLTIVGGALYQQSTVRIAPAPAPQLSAPDPEEKTLLLDPIHEGDEGEGEEREEGRKGKTSGGVHEPVTVKVESL